MKRKYFIPFFPILISFLLFPLCSDESISESSFCKSLQPVGRILEDPEWTNWDMAPIYDDSGKVHLFVGRWQKNSSWLKSAQIVHLIADKPEGPYTFLDTVFQNDTISFYNPQINKIDNIYVLVFAYKLSSSPNLQQMIGLATSASLYGPWKISEHNPVIGPSFIPGSANCLHASNPTFLRDAAGKYRIYYKSISDMPDNPYLRTVSLAVSENIQGPYSNYNNNPLISYADHGLDVEDPYAFYYKGKYYLILEDRRGVIDLLEGKEIKLDQIKDGGWRPGLLYNSDDGITWNKPEIGYKTNSYYFNEPISRFERPHILWKNEQPDYLFLALENGKFGLGTGAVLKINNWN